MSTSDRYVVMSRREDGVDRVELARTSKGVAYQDVELLRSIVHCRAWVQEPNKPAPVVAELPPLEFVEEP